jgi:hypothetical protein
MIQKGDIVFLMQPKNICTLEINKPYRVYHKYHDLIAIEGDIIIGDDVDDDDYNFDTDNLFKRDERYYYYNELRFKKDIRLERKLKLSKISKVRNDTFSSQKT